MRCAGFRESVDVMGFEAVEMVRQKTEQQTITGPFFASTRFFCGTFNTKLQSEEARS